MKNWLHAASNQSTIFFGLIPTQQTMILLTYFTEDDPYMEN